MPASAQDVCQPRFVRSHSDLCYVPRPRCGTYSPPTHGFTALRRSFSSTFTLIPEERSVPLERPDLSTVAWNLVTWVPKQTIRTISAFLQLIFHPAWTQLFVVLPTLWLAAWLFVFWKCVQWPIAALRMVVRALSSIEDRKPRTVVISGGSTIQALQLARNFHLAGARVVAFEIEGLFELLKYSAAVERFYTVPRPHAADPSEYVNALSDIVKRESAVFFVPVSTTSPAYYDSLAKPYLEVLGCQSFIPGAREVLNFDDPLQVMRVCRHAALPTPRHTVVTKEEDITEWNEKCPKDDTRHFIASAGIRGARDRIRFELPRDQTFKLPTEICSDRPWIIVHEPKGEKYLTCTTLKESRAVLNVTCKLDATRKGLLPLKDTEIDAWISKFVSRLEPKRPMTGHVSFRLVRDAETGQLLPLGARVGVSLPYLCQVSKVRCKHSDGTGVAAVTKLLDHVIDKREALFAYWDPLPYCAYYKSRQPDHRVPPPPCKSPPNVPL